MQFSVPIFLTVLLLGVLQLTVGVVVGRCLPMRRAGPAPAPGDEARYAAQLADRLSRLISNVAHDVGAHQLQIQQVNRDLAATHENNAGEVTELVLGAVAHILRINDQLQTRLSAAEERLQQQSAEIQSHVVEARTDPLTRLPNRRAFDDELVRRIAEWQRRNVEFCLMMIDVDHFKKLNDQHGHLAGDHALRRIAEVLRGALRDADMIARVGGEEFAVLLPNTEAGAARQTAEALRASVASEEFVFEKSRQSLSVSLGLSTVQTGDDPVLLVCRADEALYAAKRAGRNCGYFHNGLTCQRMQQSDQPESDLREICDSLRQRVAEVTEQGGI